MSYVLPEKLHRALDSICLPDGSRRTNDQLARIQQLQIEYHLEHRSERDAIAVRDLWSSPPGSVSLVYARRGQIVFLRGRLKFGGARQSAPFPSAIVIFWGGQLGKATRPEA